MNNSHNDKCFLLKFLHQMLAYNVMGPDQYQNRYNGFNGELHFSEWFKKHKKSALHPGGIFVPLSSTSDSFLDAIYILVSPDNGEQAINSLKSVSGISLKGQFLISYSDNEPINEWQDLKVATASAPLSIPIPSSFKLYFLAGDNLKEITVNDFEEMTGLIPYFGFNANVPQEMMNKYIEKFSCYSYEDILSVYMSRVALDVLCSLHGPHKKFQRGAPLDIDFFIEESKGHMSIIEVKEKDLSRNGCFGMDVRRIDSLLFLSSYLSGSAYYIVRHINNQDEREFVGWKAIRMSKFYKMASTQTTQGGFGMRRKGGDNPTRLCSQKYFKEITKDY